MWKNNAIHRNENEYVRVRVHAIALASVPISFPRYLSRFQFPPVQCWVLFVRRFGCGVKCILAILNDWMGLINVKQLYKGHIQYVQCAVCSVHLCMRMLLNRKPSKNRVETVRWMQMVRMQNTGERRSSRSAWAKWNRTKNEEWNWEGAKARASKLENQVVGWIIWNEFANKSISTVRGPESPSNNKNSDRKLRPKHIVHM